LALAIIGILFQSRVLLAAPKDVCIFTDKEGKILQVMGRDAVPSAQRTSARCFSPKVSGSDSLAAPTEIKLEGAQRSDTFVTAVGPIKLRWPRSVESAFGRTPQRAVAEAAAAVSRTLKKPGFPAALRSLDIPWQIVFMDEELPEQQIPWYLVTNCHPAWMTPVANLYFVAQRVVAGCGNATPKRGAVADATLATVLLHEMGHVIEFQLLQGLGVEDRRRAEGFASWFEQYAAEQSPLIPRGSVAREHLTIARRSLARGDDLFAFQGTAEDYARAALPFVALEKRRGVAGIMKVYELMRGERLDFPSALKKAIGWDRRELVAEIKKIVS
jgi:hypothetical protein